MAFASAAAGFQGLHPFHRSGIPALAFLPPDLPEPKFLPILTLLQPELFPVSRRSAVCTASRLVAFRGSRLLASISRDRVSLSSHPCWYDRRVAEPGLGDMLSTT